MTETVACDGCGVIFDPQAAGLAFCMGGTPEYYCQKCEPPSTAEEAIKSIDNFMLERDGE